MRFIPLPDDYGAHLLGRRGDDWRGDPSALIDAFRRERALLAPDVWIVGGLAGGLAAAAAAAGPDARAILATPAWTALRTAVRHLADAGAVPALPGATLLAAGLQDLAETSSAETEDAIDDASLLLAGLVRALIEDGARAVALIERPGAVDPGLLAEFRTPVLRVVEHHRATAWLVFDGAAPFAGEAGGTVAGTLFPAADVRAGPADADIGLGLDAAVLARPLTPADGAEIAAAAAGAAAFAPIVPAGALPEAVLALAGAVGARRAA